MVYGMTCRLLLQFCNKWWAAYMAYIHIKKRKLHGNASIMTPSSLERDLWRLVLKERIVQLLNQPCFHMPDLLQTHGKVWTHISTENFVGTRSGITKPEIGFQLQYHIFCQGGKSCNKLHRMFQRLVGMKNVVWLGVFTLLGLSFVSTDKNMSKSQLIQM